MGTSQTLGQPKGLYFLFTVELWERYAFYTVNGLLILYLTKALLFSDDKAYSLFAAFSALIWLTPSIGGFLADRFFGFRKILMIGGILLIIGYALLALHRQSTFYLAMSFLLIGNGFFKPCIEGLLGTLYEGAKDPRRDSGFTIYYMGINIGGMLGPIISGFLAAQFGWEIGFLAASLGMLIGLLIFIFGRKHLGNRGLAPELRIPNQYQFLLPLQVFLQYGLIVAVIIAGYFLLLHVSYANITVELLGSLILIAYFVSAFRQDKASRQKMLACLGLVLFSIAFWTLYQQAPMSVNLFTERNVDRVFFGYTIPTVMFQSLNPIFIVFFTPIMNAFWNEIARRRWFMSTAMKFVWGIFLMGLGFLVLNWSVTFSNDGIVSVSWLIASYMLQSVGELALSPIGLSMMTGMAPKNTIGLMIGTWYLASAASNAIAGIVAKFSSIPEGNMPVIASAHIYAKAFAWYGGCAISVAFIGLLCVPLLSRMMGESNVR
jgi:proton-dependent oligopeptide transporter, POT family